MSIAVPSDNAKCFPAKKDLGLGKLVDDNCRERVAVVLRVDSSIRLQRGDMLNVFSDFAAFGATRDLLAIKEPHQIILHRKALEIGRASCRERV